MDLRFYTDSCGGLPLTLVVGNTSAEAAMEALFDGRIAATASAHDAPVGTATTEADEESNSTPSELPPPPPSAQSAQAMGAAAASAPPALAAVVAAGGSSSGVLGEIETLGFLYADETVGSRGGAGGAAAAQPSSRAQPQQEGNAPHGEPDLAAAVTDYRDLSKYVSDGIASSGGDSGGEPPVRFEATGDPDSEELQLVCGMGFNRADAMAALGACSGNMDQAVEMLLGGGQ